MLRGCGNWGAEKNCMTRFDSIKWKIFLWEGSSTHSREDFIRFSESEQFWWITMMAVLCVHKQSDWVCGFWFICILVAKIFPACKSARSYETFHLNCGENLDGGFKSSWKRIRKNIFEFLIFFWEISGKKA